MRRYTLTGHQDLNTKPRASRIRPEITRLPEITPWRMFARKFFRTLTKLLVSILYKPTISGEENFPRQGPALFVINHLGDADGVVAIALAPRPLEFLAKSELYDYPILGWLMRAYGMIWVHRGQPDRRALSSAMQGLKQGRLVVIAPEGRESITGGLEEGTFGAAYLAYKTGIDIVPVALTNTQNWRLKENILHLRKTHITVTIGTPFQIDIYPDWRMTIEAGTEKIMHTLASLLPEQYQGVYQQSARKNA